MKTFQQTTRNCRPVRLLFLALWGLGGRNPAVTSALGIGSRGDRARTAAAQQPPLSPPPSSVAVAGVALLCPPARNSAPVRPAAGAVASPLRAFRRGGHTARAAAAAAAAGSESLADSGTEAVASRAETAPPPPWSMRHKLVAEALGTGFIVLGGCGAVASSLTGAWGGIGQMACAWGVTVALAIHATAPVSGAHLNPAVTLSFLLVRPNGLTATTALKYMFAQLVGAVFGGLATLALHGPTLAAFERGQGIVRGDPLSVLSASALCEYFPNPSLTDSSFYAPRDVSALRALGVEAWGTAVLCFVIFALTHPRNAAADSAASAPSAASSSSSSFREASPSPRPAVPALIGATVALLLCLYAPLTMACWNPARDLGPRLVAALPQALGGGGWGSIALARPSLGASSGGGGGGFWVYLAGPMLGGPLGAWLADRVLYRRPRKVTQ